MRQYDDSAKLRVPNPARPKLIATALAASVLVFSASHAQAATVIAMGANCQNRDASLISNPSYDTPGSVNGVGEAVYRVSLSATGQIKNLTLEQSAGDPLLNFTAMHVIRESRFAAAVADCKPSAESFLVGVNFDDN